MVLSDNEHINTDILLLTEVHSSLRFPQFSPNVLLLSQDPILHLVIIIRLLFAVRIYFWWLWQFWRILIFCVTSHTWHLSDVSSWLDCGWEYLEGRCQRYIAILMMSYQGNILSAWHITVDVNLGHVAKIVFIRFLYWMLCVFSFFHAEHGSKSLPRSHLSSKE